MRANDYSPLPTEFIIIVSKMEQVRRGEKFFARLWERFARLWNDYFKMRANGYSPLRTIITTAIPADVQQDTAAPARDRGPGVE